MSGARSPFVAGALALLLASCRIEGEAVSPDGAKPDSENACNSSMIAELRAQRAAEPWPGTSSFGEHRVQLQGSCEGGCGVACLELARTTGDAAEFDAYNKKACELGEAIGCTLGEPPTPETAAKLCDAGEVLACASAAVLAFEAAPDQPPNFERVAQAAKSGCADNDGRACSIESWLACAGVGTCDVSALAFASKAASLMPTAEVLETLALVHCHSGAAEQADSVLAAACEAGHADSCARRCELMNGTGLLVREAERARYDGILVAMALQADVAPHWYAALSAMDTEQLAGFDAMLDRFMPAMTEAGAKAKVPPDVRERFPVLVEAILRAPQVDAKKIKYWFSRLPDMTDEQRSNLLESLRNQWWVLAGEPGESPRGIVDRVRLSGGGLTPAWTDRAR